VRAFSDGGVIGHRLYVFGGLMAGRSRSLWFYDFQNKTWKRVMDAEGTIPPARSGHSLTVVGKSFYVFGGESDPFIHPDTTRDDTKVSKSLGLRVKTLSNRVSAKHLQTSQRQLYCLHTMLTARPPLCTGGSR
jgi:hypothetical protein